MAQKVFGLCCIGCESQLLTNSFPAAAFSDVNLKMVTAIGQ
jgi:hypothetical protein